MSRGNNSKRRPIWGWGVLLLALLVQAGCASQTVQSTLLPAVTGSDVDGARQRLEALGFEVQIEPVEEDRLAERFGPNPDLWPDHGTVFDQRPPAGAVLKPATVRLLVARHATATTVVETPVLAPATAGLSVDDAQQVLAREGVELRTTSAGVARLTELFGPNAGRWPASGQIVAQSPPEGTPLDAGQQTVSAEVANWSLAQLNAGPMVGAPAAEVKRRLEEAGFVVETRSRAPSDAPDARLGEVLSAQVTGYRNGQNVVQLIAASADGANVVPPPPPPRDADGDGVPDTRDRCPNQAGPVGTGTDGCPPSLDADRDGVPDGVDRCDDTPSGVAVDQNGCERVVVGTATDSDGDGVPDDQDLCPDSPPGSLGAPQGCTLTQRVNLLPTGLYAFNRQTVMEVGRPEGYKIVLVLDPRTGAVPGDVEARVLSDLPASDTPPEREIQVLDSGDECTPPIVCFRAKYYEKMRVDLRVDQDDWKISPDNPVEVRAVVSDQVTRWGWTVVPACNGGSVLGGECEEAELTLDAYAMFDDTGYGPIMVFNEKITVEVAAEERVTSFFERHRELIISAIIVPIFIALLTWWLARRRRAPAQVATPAAPEYEAVSVLFVGANPRGTSRIRLDEEIRGIDQSIRLGERRESFTLHQHWAARVSDLDDALMRYRPNIVHISAHGTQDGELLLEGGDGDDGKVSARQLEKLFAILSDDIRLVVLNACFSEEQARLIVNHVDCVVGMSDAVNDKVAQRFSESFYLALANGRSVQIAFELARVESQGKSADAVPRLLALRSDPNRVEFARRAPTRHIEGVHNG